MANEATTIHGSYVEIIATAAITAGGVSVESTSVAAAIVSATEETIRWY